MAASDPVAQLISMLLAEGKGRGFPMRASPELRQYMREANAAIPDPDSFSAQNVELMPGPSAEQIMGGAAPPPISQDPWFDQAATSVGQSLPETNLEGSLYIWATNPQGKRVRLDGPFTNEMDAMRELQLLRKSGGRHLQMDIGPE